MFWMMVRILIKDLKNSWTFFCLEAGIDELLAALSYDFPPADESNNRGVEDAATSSSSTFNAGKKFDDSRSTDNNNEIHNSGVDNHRSDQGLAVDSVAACPYLATKSLEELNGVL